MEIFNEQVILEFGNSFTEWKKELVLTHHIFGDLPHFWLVEKVIFDKTRCPFICDCFVFHTISGDIRTFTLSVKYKSYPTFYDTILVPIFEKYCAENNIELKIIKRDIYG